MAQRTPGCLREASRQALSRALRPNYVKMIATAKPLLGPMQAIGPPRVGVLHSLLASAVGVTSREDQEVPIHHPLLWRENPCKWCQFPKLSCNYKRKRIFLAHYPEITRMGGVTGVHSASAVALGERPAVQSRHICGSAIGF